MYRTNNQALIRVLYLQKTMAMANPDSLDGSAPKKPKICHSVIDDAYKNYTRNVDVDKKVFQDAIEME